MKAVSYDANDPQFRAIQGVQVLPTAQVCSREAELEGIHAVLDHNYVTQGP